MGAIKEKDLFRSLVAPEELVEDLESDIRGNIRDFYNMIPVNIFRNGYYVLYEAIKATKKYGIIMNYQHFNQIVLNNAEKLMESANVNLSEMVDDVEDEYKSREQFIATCCNLYEYLSEEPKESSRLKLNIKLYVEQWVQDQLGRILADTYLINTKGMNYKGKFLQGARDADEYYTKESSRVKELFNIDELGTSETVIGPEGYEEYKASRDEEIGDNVVSHLGIESVDDEIGDLVKQTVLVIQGGPGGGKTRMSVNIGYNALVEGRNGVHFALEGSIRRAQSLYIAKHLAEKYDIDTIDDDMVYRKSYDPQYASVVEAAEYDLFHNKDYGKVKMIAPPLYDEEVEGILERIWDEEFNFDWVLIDYTSLVSSRTYDSVTGTLTNLMPKLEILANSFKDEGFLLILPHQLTRDGVEEIIDGGGSSKKTITKAADAMAVTRSAHISITVYTDDELKLKDKCKIICTKTRHSSGFNEREVFAKLGCCMYRDLPEELLPSF